MDTSSWAAVLIKRINDLEIKIEVESHLKKRRELQELKALNCYLLDVLFGVSKILSKSEYKKVYFKDDF
jgi:hypothetical protein